MARKKTAKDSATNGGVSELLKQLFQAAMMLRGSIEPADYNRCVLH